ncbi:Short-chain dehydrogenase/reductase, conserved site [Acididesulfobacillus acetoxydans]|uniref:General stress protein 39 n=1 Tax=Acididesulfobacillus acetoxydans TaxID=1561005 RepID=A0A8S0XBU5_9FIRM|nr:SDR family oxidoreductase [Acididesulfobacillus acetoxydans]CAA7601636.1 Short-chain dehydrogenase/reductase, conserved site [Acididesulfobacillus acetoxydans]CEJ07123.1 General stress protein 39 [Acididesulfobacillus acetoxydans]
MSQTKTPQPAFPAQHQDPPGLESLMNPRPLFEDPGYRGSGKLQNKVALISGGDSGIGKAAAIAFAHEEADLALIYLSEHEDAAETKKRIEQLGRRCLLLAGDVGLQEFCRQAVKEIIQELGQIDILVNNAGEQHPQNSLADISAAQLERTFRTNVFGQFYLTQAVLPHLRAGSTIINTTSITAYAGHELLIDYSASKGAVVSFTRSLSESLAKTGIRVNGVAPGPIWTPLIPSTFSPQDVSVFGSTVPLQRAGQPYELAPAYVFLAGQDSAYMSGQILHVNGGQIVNG